MVLLLCATACPSSKPQADAGFPLGPATLVKPGTAATAPKFRDLAAPYRRPIKLAQLKRGQQCPVTPGRRLSNERVSGFALGSGPVSVILDTQRDRHGLFYARGYPPVKGWYDIGTIWMVSPRVRGDVLLRAQSLDGRGPIGLSPYEFTLLLNVSTSTLERPTAALLLPTVVTREGFNLTRSGWRNYRGFLDFQRGGCYGVQIDGSNFSYSIVFRAAL